MRLGLKPMAEGHTSNGRNRFLAALESSITQHKRKSLELVQLVLRQELYSPNLPIDHVYFPVNGVVPMLAQIDKCPMV